MIINVKIPRKYPSTIKNQEHPVFPAILTKKDGTQYKVTGNKKKKLKLIKFKK